jgi:hypothetical protein
MGQYGIVSAGVSYPLSCLRKQIKGGGIEHMFVIRTLVRPLRWLVSEDERHTV